MALEKEELKQVIEALIFASDYPLSAKKISEIVKSCGVDDVEKIIVQLNNEYKKTDRAFEIRKSGGGYRFFTLKKHFLYLKELFKGRKKSKLSRAALETLSIIAYKQPISRIDMESIRGVGISEVIHTLLERKLIMISGRGKGPGRPLLYSTTPDFLQYFGLNDVSELPSIKEINEILDKREIVVSDETE